MLHYDISVQSMHNIRILPVRSKINTEDMILMTFQEHDTSPGSQVPNTSVRVHSAESEGTPSCYNHKLRNEVSSNPVSAKDPSP